MAITSKSGLIFIAEDNTIYAKTLGLFLEKRFPGTEVRIFPVGELCLDNMHHNPDFVIMDYALDSRYTDASNGLELAREIRSKNARVRIVLLSGQEDIRIALEAMNTPGCGYILKDANAFENVAAVFRQAS